MTRLMNVRRLLRLPYSLRNRLLIILPLTALTPLVLIGSISYYSMHAILTNKIEAGVLGHLHEVRISLDNTLSQLNHVSQQLAYDGAVGKTLDKYLISNVSDKKMLKDEIEDEISLISFSNPDVGLIFYYSRSSGERFFANYQVDPSLSIDSLPKLMQANLITYYGPHKSLNPLDGRLVFSARRHVSLEERDDIDLYIETSYKRVETILQSQKSGMGYIHLIVDDKGTIVYSENADAFHVGEAFPAIDPAKPVYNGYYAFEEHSNQSWKIVSLIPKSDYQYEINRWIAQFTAFAILSIAVACLFAGMLWRTLYRPLRNLIRDIRDVKNRNLTAPIRKSDNLEFDLIHGEFESMRGRIAGLIDEIREKEKRKAKLEVEKLMVQINPHFLLNTLDTIRWMARSEGQLEIDRMISMLNKLLHYNLRNNGEASIRDELEAVRNYVRLQEVRYHVRFEIMIQVDDRMMDVAIPSFILQPLVENALQHGLDGGGVIEVEISHHEKTFLQIAVKDYGRGMSEDQIARLMEKTRTPADHGLGMGIGLQYVIRMLKHKFGDRASFRIDSQVGQHTAITLTIPLLSTGGETA